MPLHESLANCYAGQFAARVFDYLLQERGLSLQTIRRYRLGWNGRRITIPIFDRWDKLAFFKVARAPEDSSKSSKMSCWPSGSQAELYGWENLTRLKRKTVIICEGEFDRLVLETHGFASVSGTAGAGVFLEEWAQALSQVPEVFICYDQDEAGRAGAERVAALLPHVRIVELPKEVGTGGDVTDFFMKLGKDRDDCLKLLHDAKPLSLVRRRILAEKRTVWERQTAAGQSRDPRIQGLKESVSIEEVARPYVKDLRRVSHTFVGRCPFHDDQHPSLVLYPEQGRFYCYGCRTHGDVIQFLMEAECLSFPQALTTLEDYLKQSA